MIDSFRHASFSKNYSYIKNLLKQSVDLNETDCSGRNALMYALVDNLDIEIIRLLIKSGVQVNSTDNQKWTPLHYATNAQNLEAVKSLLENNAEIEAKDIFGNTPLWRCVMNNNSNPEIIQLLLKKGASPNNKNNSGNSARDIAIKLGNNQILELFNQD